MHQPRYTPSVGDVSYSAQDPVFGVSIISNIIPAKIKGACQTSGQMQNPSHDI